MALKVSVVIDNYNYGRYLGQAIDGVLSQDYAGPIECIVSDDGSTDDSKRIIASYGTRIRAISGPNKGQATAFNAGFAVATGDIVCLLDSDDYWEKGKLRAVVPLFSDPAVVAAQHFLQDVDAGGAAIPRRFPAWPPRYGLEDYLDRRAQFGATSGIAFRGSVLKKILPLPADIFYYLDDLLLVKAMLHGDVANLPKVEGFHRIHGANFCAQGLRDPKKLELDLRMRGIFRREVDPLLAGKGLRRSARHDRLEELEVARRKILLRMLRGERLGAIRQWLDLAARHGATRAGAFKAVTCLAALLSPGFYFRLYERYEGG